MKLVNWYIAAFLMCAALLAGIAGTILNTPAAPVKRTEVETRELKAQQVSECIAGMPSRPVEEARRECTDYHVHGIRELKHEPKPESKPVSLVDVDRVMNQKGFTASQRAFVFGCVKGGATTEIAAACILVAQSQ